MDYLNNRTTSVALFIYLNVERRIGAGANFCPPSCGHTQRLYIIMAHFAGAITVISILHPFRQSEGNEWGTMSGGTWEWGGGGDMHAGL